MSYFFYEAARVEHLEHVSYYEARQAGLGARYTASRDIRDWPVTDPSSRA